MTALDSKTLSVFLKMAGDRLEGDWVIIGGIVLALLGIRHRVTLDIDIVGPAEATQEQTLALMEIAEKLGLPVEAINQVGAFFLRRIPGWETLLVRLHEGKSAVIHRPQVTLYILLKLRRFTETDLVDCLEFLRFARKAGEKPDKRRIRKAVRDLLRKNPPAEKRRRLDALLDAMAQGE